MLKKLLKKIKCSLKSSCCRAEIECGVKENNIKKCCSQITIANLPADLMPDRPLDSFTT